MKKPHLATAAGESTFLLLRQVHRTHGGNIHRIALRFALERFLHRLFDAGPDGKGTRLLLSPENDVSISRDAITLKGGMTMVFAEELDPLKGRSTGDADLHLAAFPGSMADYAAILAEVLAGPPRSGPDDGVRFDVEGIKVARDREERSGGSVTIPLQIGQLWLQIKTDVTFDARPMHDRAPVVEYPSVLPAAGLPPPVIRRVPYEFMMADKVSAALQYGAANIRLRDYHDMRLVLARPDLVDDGFLARTVAATLRFKGTDVPADLDGAPGFSDAFAAAKQSRWREESKAKNYRLGDDFPGIVGWIRDRLRPVMAAAADVDDLPEWASTRP